MSADNWDPESICRDENCPIIGRHLKHPVKWKPKDERLKPKAHHRPDPNKKVWSLDDQEGLRQCVLRATSTAEPVCFGQIFRNVTDDYGKVSERTVYRYVAKSVDSGEIVKIDLGLPMAAYVKPGSHWLRDRAALREYMSDYLDYHDYSQDAG